MKKDVLKSLYDEAPTHEGRFIDEVATEFEALLNDWHSQPEVFDRKLDSEIHRWYTNPPQVFTEKPFFSPSASSADKRQLFYKAKGYAEDGDGQLAQQGRWTRIGTAIGDIIQRDLLFIEKHGERKLGYKPRFRFERTPSGRPMFEEFAKKNHPVTHNGVFFNISGSPDGVMIYTCDDGEQIRIGLEVKSKQTTAAKTSLYSMKEAERKHEEQCLSYAMMFNCDFYLIAYVNTAHKSWKPSEADIKATPDLRVFGVECTQERKNKLLDRFAEIQQMINDDVLPPTDLYNFTFNNYKKLTALSLTAEEMAEAEAENERLQTSRAPAFVKNNYRRALEEVKELREKFANEV